MLTLKLLLPLLLSLLSLRLSSVLSEECNEDSYAERLRYKIAQFSGQLVLRITQAMLAEESIKMHKVFKELYGTAGKKPLLRQRLERFSELIADIKSSHVLELTELTSAADINAMMKLVKRPKPLSTERAIITTSSNPTESPIIKKDTTKPSNRNETELFGGLPMLSSLLKFLGNLFKGLKNLVNTRQRNTLRTWPASYDQEDVLPLLGRLLRSVFNPFDMSDAIPANRIIKKSMERNRSLGDPIADNLKIFLRKYLTSHATDFRPRLPCTLESQFSKYFFEIYDAVNTPGLESETYMGYLWFIDKMSIT